MKSSKNIYEIRRTLIVLGLMLVAAAFRLALTGDLNASAAQTDESRVERPASISSTTPATAKKISAAGAPVRYVPSSFSRRAEFYYSSIWGVDSLKVKSTESNEIIRFTYRVLDAAKAKPLNDEKNTPSLTDPKAGVKLVVPSLEKVGKLRQISSPQAGKMYWMAFSNKGRLVKPGDRVNVVIGNFRANGLVVE